MSLRVLIVPEDSRAALSAGARFRAGRNAFIGGFRPARRERMAPGGAT